MNVRLLNGRIDSLYFARIYTYSDGKTIGIIVGPFDSCISTYIRTPPFRYALVAYYGARVSSCYVEIARVRVLFHGMGISLRLSWRTPLLIRNGLQSPVLLRQLSTRRVSRLATSSSSSFSAVGWSHTSIPSYAHACIHRRYLACTRKRFPHSNRDQIDERLRFVPRRYDTEIKGHARERRAAVRTVAAQMARLEDH